MEESDHCSPFKQPDSQDKTKEWASKSEMLLDLSWLLKTRLHVSGGLGHSFQVRDEQRHHFCSKWQSPGFSSKLPMEGTSPDVMVSSLNFRNGGHGVIDESSFTEQ